MANLRSRSGFWIETAISYAHTNDKGITKEINEKYVVEAADFGQAEERIRKEMDCDNRHIKVKAVNRPKYGEICFDDESNIDTFFKVKVVEHEDVEVRGGFETKTKNTSRFYLVQADSIEKARIAVNDVIMGGSMIDFDINDVTKTKILGVLEVGKHLQSE